MDVLRLLVSFHQLTNGGFRAICNILSAPRCPSFFRVRVIGRIRCDCHLHEQTRSITASTVYLPGCARQKRLLRYRIPTRPNPCTTHRSAQQRALPRSNAQREQLLMLGALAVKIDTNKFTS